MSDDKRLQETMLISVVKDVGEVRSDIAEIKVDLREHIRRTAALETKAEFHDRHVWLAYGAIGFLGMIVTLVKIYEVFFTR